MPPVRRRSAASRRPRLHRRVKQSLVALTAVVVVVCGMAAAQAAGFDVLGMLGQWTDEIFHFTSGPESGESAAPMNENTRLLREALASVGIDEDLAPTWFPEGFTAEEPKIVNSAIGSAIHVALSNKNGCFLNVIVKQYHSPEHLESTNFEKNPEIEQYSNGHQMFYLFTNSNTITATWADGLLMEQILGNIDEGEIKLVIDSIGGV